MNINVMEELIYEDHMLTLWDAELNMEEIMTAIDATVAAAKRKPEKKIQVLIIYSVLTDLMTSSQLSC